MSEHDQQCVVVEWFKHQYKFPKGLIFSVPNGAFLAGTKRQRENQMKKLKKEGLNPGVPDLVIAVANNQYHGLYVEMKDVGKTENSLTSQQKAKLLYLNYQGYKAVWCQGAEEAIKVIREYMSLK